MAFDYDENLRTARLRVTKTIAGLLDDSKKPEDMAEAIDNLIKAWDEMLAAVIRERNEWRDLTITLVSRIAELRKGQS